MASINCWYCEAYNQYQPIDKKIASLAQIEKRKKRKQERKVKKISDASKRGKANRRNGRQAERDLVKYLVGLGLDARLVPASGAFKNTNVIKALEGTEFMKRMTGDIKLHWKDDIYTIESKRDSQTDSLYKKIENGAIHIKGFAYFLSQTHFEYVLNKLDIGSMQEVEDKGYKKIHKYFEQDNSDIVVISRPYHERLFFLTETMYKVVSEGM